ncbi:uncharacterized protein LOC127808334 isoform X2 [Diospyros lotus]|uniref:uncharacterized protein LOC127808334 isoform X2 n=1 Tax=Diospyros lotus TaxID=55363 RepID=UPI002252204C|nr:uncharacterized protein LOC127808334 isoform X2 [Diospyros lotus]
MTRVVTIANLSSIPYFPIKPKPTSPLLPHSESAAVSVSSKHLRAIEFISTRRIRRRRWNLSSSDNQAAAAVIDPATSTSSADDKDESSSPSASEVVRNFYAGINGHDLSSVEDLIAHNCVYEDLIFPRPFVGRKAILDFFQKFIDSISTDLQFVIDDISNEDASAVGVMWHLEWKGKSFPFSKGCSFYRLDVVNGKRQIMLPSEASHGFCSSFRNWQTSYE